MTEARKYLTAVSKLTDKIFEMELQDETKIGTIKKQELKCILITLIECFYRDVEVVELFEKSINEYHAMLKSLENDLVQ